MKNPLNDIETYFYGVGYNDTADRWDSAMLELSKLLEVVESSERAYTVNLSEIIEKRLGELEKADLFICCSLDAIMNDMTCILAGHVSEEWLEKFAKVLRGRKDD